MVTTGLERVLAGDVPALFDKRIALIANATTIDRRFQHAIDLFHASDRFRLHVLLGPEHGIRGIAQDMISVADERDPRTGLPVYSLYGHDAASLEPTDAMLAGVDAVVFDIQDVGSRYYTYAWTMVYAMRACARLGLPLFVLDRPNPIGGVHVEGGDIAPGYDSFVGLMSIPNRHGMTVGELARFASDRGAIGCDLHVVEMIGWRRGMAYADTGLPWVLPSPNMPTCDTALVYPGMCLIEGSELSEGRGTTRPFEIAGAPFIDGHALAEALAADDLPGVAFRPLSFLPTFQKHAGQPCGGVQLHVTDRDTFRPYLTGVALLRAVKALWPTQMAWRTRAYEFVTTIPAIDLLCGSPAVREGIDRGDSLAAIAGTWTAAERAFAAARSRWLLYS